MAILMSTKGRWTNPYGYQEQYTKKELRSSLSGHIWRGSAMETDDSCGNCDGAHCDSCRTLYTVEELSAPEPHYGEWGYDYNQVYSLGIRVFDDFKEAKEYYNSLR